MFDFGEVGCLTSKRDGSLHTTTHHQKSAATRIRRQWEKGIGVRERTDCKFRSPTWIPTLKMSKERLGKKYGRFGRAQQYRQIEEVEKANYLQVERR